MVLFKVVSGVDSRHAWDVSKTANHQNAIRRVDLEIAEFMRPQLVRSMLTLSHGITIRSSTDVPVSALLTSMCKTVIAYEEVKNLFVALFMNNPRQVFHAPYNRIASGLDQLRREYRTPEKSRDLITLLAEIVKESNDALSDLQEASRDGGDFAGFRKLFNDRNSYAPYIAVVGLMFHLNISSEEDLSKRKKDLPRFLGEVQAAIHGDSAAFRSCVSRAAITIANYADTKLGKEKIKSNLHGLMERTPVEGYYRQYLRMQRFSTV
jgi:hypothetical protein